LSFAIVAYDWLVHHVIFAFDARREGRPDLGELALSAHRRRLAVFDRGPRPLPTRIGYGLNLAACTSALACAWFVAERARLIEQLAARQRRYIVRRFALQLTSALVGVACACVAPVLGLSSSSRFRSSTR
jgi:hypothetical protein